MNVGGDRRIAVFGKFEHGLGDEDRPRQDVGDDRQRIDARIENAETAGLPDPFLVRMPVADILFPDHMHAFDRRRCKKRLGGFDRRRIARMPAGKQRRALFCGKRLEVGDFAQRRAGWLFQEDVLAGDERLISGLVAVLRRHAERNGIDRRLGVEHRLDRRIAVDAFDSAMAAGRGDELEIGILGDGGEMLVADDLADADDGEIDRRHGFSLEPVKSMIYCASCSRKRSADKLSLPFYCIILSHDGQSTS